MIQSLRQGLPGSGRDPPQLSLRCRVVISVRSLPFVLALAFLASAPAASAAPREVPRGFQGVMYDGASLDSSSKVRARQFDLMARSGVESLRVVFIWEAMQPERGAQFDFSRTDEIVRLSSQRGITVLPVMLIAPPWARVYRDRLLSPPVTGPYLKYLQASIRRYGSKGTFWRENPRVRRRPLRDWQIWNEPNIRAFWDVRKSHPRYGYPGGYANLLRAANRTIKATDRSARTVMGGLVGPSWVELRKLYRAGARRSFDVMALHIYAQTERRVLGAVRRVRAELDAAGDTQKPIFLTETAFPASRGRAKAIRGQRQESPASMAKSVTTLFSLLARTRAPLRLDRVHWYTWASGYDHRTSNFEYAGLLASPDGERFRPQPALSAFRRTARRLQGCAKNVRGACARRPPAAR